MFGSARLPTLVMSLSLLAFAVSMAAATDFATVLTDLDNKPILSGAEGKEEPMTLGKVTSMAVVSTFQDEQQLGGEEKVKRFALALKVRTAGDLVLTAEEIALCKKLIAKAFGPVIVGRAWALLDPASTKTP